MTTTDQSGTVPLEAAHHLALVCWNRGAGSDVNGHDPAAAAQQKWELGAVRVVKDTLTDTESDTPPPTVDQMRDRLAAAMACLHECGVGIEGFRDLDAAALGARADAIIGHAIVRLEREPDRAAVGSTLARVLANFQRRLYLPDPAPLYALLGAVAANYMAGAPVWLLLVGPPGSGKTELVSALDRLPHIFKAATLTEASLLSGSPRREKARDATGGLLRQIGEFGFIICKDFTSVLSMHRDHRAAVLAALREIFDGAWTRLLGSDGGCALKWTGKVGLIAACTPAIDSHHGVMSTMGERFVFCRQPKGDSRVQGRTALDHVRGEYAMRTALADAVGALFAGVAIPAEFPPIAEDVRERLVNLADLAVRCRSAVERDRYSREIDDVPEAEAPGRLALTLARLYLGMQIVGVDAAEAWCVTVKCAFDSMPQLRRVILEYLLNAADWVHIEDIVTAVRCPLTTVRRGCQDLAAHSVLDRKPGKGGEKAALWRLSEETHERFNAIAPSIVPIVSAMSKGTK